jgi:hypothetical protein
MEDLVFTRCLELTMVLEFDLTVLVRALLITKNKKLLSSNVVCRLLSETMLALFETFFFRSPTG